MTRVTYAMAAGVMMAACSPVPSPIVEKPGTSPEQINRDMAWCRNNMPAFAWGNPVTTCMRDKGYTILHRA